MDRRSFISQSAAAGAVLGISSGVTLAASGDAFDSLLKACAADNLSMQTRLKSLQGSGWKPVGNQLDAAINVIADGMAILPVVRSDGPATTRAFHKRTRANVAANMRRVSARGYTSIALAYNDPAGPVYAHLLQGGDGARIYCSAGATNTQTADGFLTRYFDQVPDYFDGKGFFRTEFPKRAKAGAKTKARILVSRLDANVLKGLTGGQFKAEGSMTIVTRPAR